MKTPDKRKDRRNEGKETRERRGQRHRAEDETHG